MPPPRPCLSGLKVSSFFITNHTACFPFSLQLATGSHCSGHGGRREPRPKDNRTKMYCTHRAGVRAFGTHRDDGRERLVTSLVRG